VEVCIGTQIILRGPISKQNVATIVVSRLSGGCIGDQRISSNYVIVVI
jgi:hypothetical protein